MCECITFLYSRQSLKSQPVVHQHVVVDVHLLGACSFLRDSLGGATAKLTFTNGMITVVDRCVYVQ